MTIQVKVNPQNYKVEVTYERLIDNEWVRSHSTIIEPNSSEHIFNPYKDMRLVIAEVD